MVTHVMSDGTKRDSIAGFVVPAGHPIYKILKTEIQNVKANSKDTSNQNTLMLGESDERNAM